MVFDGDQYSFYRLNVASKKILGDNKGIFRSRKSKKTQTIQRLKNTNNDLHTKLKIEQIESRVNDRCQLTGKLSLYNAVIPL